VLWLEPAALGKGKGTTRRLLLFYTQSSRAECRRPAAGKMPALWVPGGRGLHSSTSQLNLSRFGHSAIHPKQPINTPYSPNTT